MDEVQHREPTVGRRAVEVGGRQVDVPGAVADPGDGPRDGHLLDDAVGGQAVRPRRRRAEGELLVSVDLRTAVEIGRDVAHEGGHRRDVAKMTVDAVRRGGRAEHDDQEKGAGSDQQRPSPPQEGSAEAAAPEAANLESHPAEQGRGRQPDEEGEEPRREQHR